MAAKFALLIGNQSFRHPSLVRLSAPQRDVRALAATLEDPKIADFKTELRLDVSLVDAKKAISWLFNARQPDDFVLFYYSGHGLKDTGGTFYLATTESDPQDPDPGSIDVTWFRQRMNACASLRQVLILDCCYSGSLIPQGMTGRASSVGPVLDERTFDPAGHGRFIMAATTADGSAFEQGGSSLYTRHLVEGLRTGGAAPSKERISISDLHDFVARRVAESTPSIMRPQLWVDATTNPEPLYIARNNNVRKSLDQKLVQDLWSDDSSVMELSVYRLGEIVKSDTNNLGHAARHALEERLAAGSTMTYEIGSSINSILHKDEPSKFQIQSRPSRLYYLLAAIAILSIIGFYFVKSSGYLGLAQAKFASAVSAITRQADLERVTKERDALAEERDALVIENGDLNVKNQAVNTKNSQLEKAIDDTSRELNSTKSNNLSAVQNLQSTIESLSQEISELKQRQITFDHDSKGRDLALNALQLLNLRVNGAGLGYEEYVVINNAFSGMGYGSCPTPDATNLPVQCLQAKVESVERDVGLGVNGQIDRLSLIKVLNAYVTWIEGQK